MRRTGRTTRWARPLFTVVIAAVAALASPCGGRAFAQEESAAAGGAPESIAIAASGAEQLKVANAIQRQSFKKKGEEKRSILLRAADAFRVVVERFPDDDKAASTALLRAGSILSGLKESERALASYREVARYSSQRENCARALLEIGHILRRTKALDEALASYVDCASRFPDVDSPASQSLLWAGKIHRQRKQFEEARRSFRSLVSDYSEPASRVITAFDLLAQCYLDEKQPEKAAEVLAEVEQRFQASLASQEDDDKKVAADIRTMKAARALEKLGLRAAPPAPAPPSGEPDVTREAGEEVDEEGM